MLIRDFHLIGNKLLAYRKRAGLTQMEVAEKAGLSDRTYADIERGSVNMRIETLLAICDALCITPNDVLTEEAPSCEQKREELLSRLELCTPQKRNTALQILSVYLNATE